MDNANIGKKLSDIKLSEDLHLFGVIRNNEFNFANADFILRKKDELVIASKLN